MFPVISLLRRFAATYAYVRDDQVQNIEGQACIPLKQPTTWLNLPSGAWLGPDEHVPMFLLKVTAETREACAIAMTEKENELGESLDQALYTLLLGEEIESPVEAGFQRIVKVGAIWGVYRYGGYAMEPAETNEDVKKVRRTFGKLPPGVIHEGR